MKRFLSLADFSREQVLDLLALAQALQDKDELVMTQRPIRPYSDTNPTL